MPLGFAAKIFVHQNYLDKYKIEIISEDQPMQIR